MCSYDIKIRSASEKIRGRSLGKDRTANVLGDLLQGLSFRPCYVNCFSTESFSIPLAGSVHAFSREYLSVVWASLKIVTDHAKLQE